MNSYWLALPSTVADSVKLYEADQENYTPGEPLAKIQKISAAVHDFKTVSTLYKTYQGNTLFDLYCSADELAVIMADYPAGILLGGWSNDTQLTTPIHVSTINYMCDDFIIDDPETLEGHYEPAAQVKNINSLDGLRNFSSNATGSSDNGDLLRC